MAKNKVSEWSASPANNTDIGGIDIAEGCSPSSINNAIRELMAQVKDMQSGSDSDNFTVGGNLSVSGTSTFTGGISGALSTTGNTVLGDASGDTLTITGTTVSIPNNLNIDSNTLYVDALNNRVGIGTGSPSTALQVSGTITATTVVANLTGNVTGNVTGNADTVTNGIYTTNFTGSNQNIGTTGYQKLPGGLIMQWGEISSTSDAVESFTFPLSFPGSCFFVSVVRTDANGGIQLNATAYTASGFSIDRNNDISGTLILKYFAVGN